jgi:hypothetical protein
MRQAAQDFGEWAERFYGARNESREAAFFASFAGEVSALLEAEGIRPKSAEIGVRGQELGHATRPEKQARGVALSLGDIKDLPAKFADHGKLRALLVDRQDDRCVSLLFVFDAKGQTAKEKHTVREKVVIHVDAVKEVEVNGKSTWQPMNWMATAGLVEQHQLAGPNYQRLLWLL